MSTSSPPTANHDSDNLAPDDELTAQPPNYTFTAEPATALPAGSSTRQTPCGTDALGAPARERYAATAAVFRTIDDIWNKAIALQRLGEICRIQRDFIAARAHIWQAHLLFGKGNHITAQLICELSLSRVARGEGMLEEAHSLLYAALERSCDSGKRESEGWCLLRLGELDYDKTFVLQALGIALDTKALVLESCCRSVMSQGSRSCSFRITEETQETDKGIFEPSRPRDKSSIYSSGAGSPNVKDKAEEEMSPSALKTAASKTKIDMKPQSLVSAWKAQIARRWLSRST